MVIWFYKMIYLLACKVAEWAGEKAKIKDKQKESATKVEKEIKDVIDKVEPVNVKTRPDNDAFNNDAWNDGVHKL